MLEYCAAGGAFTVAAIGDGGVARWRSLHALLPAPDICFSPEYAQAIQDSADNATEAVCLAALTEPSGFVIKPFVLRRADGLPFMKLRGDSGPLFDISNVYPFGGPLATPDTDPALLARFERAFAQWCAEIGVVAEFTVFHPLLENDRLEPAAPIRTRKEVVWMDLTQDAEAIRREMAEDRRWGLSVARRAGVAIDTRSPDERAIAEFVPIYAETMDRVNATDRWRFPVGYYRSLAARLGGDGMTFFAATLDGVTVSLSLVLHDRETAYYHLTGWRRDTAHTHANDMLIYEMALWAKARGCKRLFLGGGVSADDGVFRFKAGFSKRRAPLKTSERIYDEPRYRQLCELRDEWDREGGRPSPPSDFFPAYRRP